MKAELQFAWRDSYHPTANAQPVGDALLALAEKTGRPFQGLTPDDVIEEARFPSSPLHNLFEWDDQQAAIMARRVAARLILNSIRIVVLSDGPKQIGFVNVTLENGGRCYVQTSVAAKHEELLKQMKEDALSGLRGWQNRYRELKELGKAHEFVDQAVLSLEADITETR